MFALLVLAPALALAQEGPSVCTGAGGCYRGAWMETKQGKEFASFQGIRYAAPPVGEFRFLRPRPAAVAEEEQDVSGVSSVVCSQGEEGSSPTPGLPGVEVAVKL